jgi:hypothetical protein
VTLTSGPVKFFFSNFFEIHISVFGSGKIALRDEKYRGKSVR